MLEHFRNYAHQSVTFDPSVNVIVGENAQGKTNLLEAAVYLSCAKSPRARTEKEMISFEADAARLTGSVFSRGRDFTVETRSASFIRSCSLIYSVVMGRTVIRGPLFFYCALRRTGRTI